jgi:hypothetical protein
MLIIGDENCAVKYNYKSTKIKIVTNYNGSTSLLINDKVFATSDNSLVIRILYHRLILYTERYKRADDTFDMRRELKIINKEVSQGKYDDYHDSNFNIKTRIGYPSYTS